MRTPPVAVAPSAPPGRSRHETAPADPLGFPALLTKTEARTALAEGQTKKTDEQPGRGHAHARGHARRDEVHAARDERAAAREARLEARRDTTPAPLTQATTEPAGDAPTSGAPVDTAGETPAPTSTNVTGATAPEPAPVPDPAAAGAVGGTAPESADGSGTEAGGVPAAVTGAPVTTGTDADDLPGATPQDVSTTAAAPATVSTPAPATPATPVAVAVDPEAQSLPPAATTDGTDPSATAVTTEETADGEQVAGDATAGDGDAPPPQAGQGRPGGAPVLPDAASDRARAAVAAAHDGVPTRAHGEPGHRDVAAAAAPTVAPVPTAAAPAAPPAPAVTPATAAALPAAWTSRGMAQTVERLVDLVHVATARGVARAKLQLHPQELGGIEVRLRQSAEGLVASITAQRADGLEAVTQAGAELRRSLEDRGLTLARLDISLAADGHGDRGWHGPQDRSAFPGRGTGRTTRDGADPLAGETVAVEPPTVTTIPGAGVLVDVQA